MLPAKPVQVRRKDQSLLMRLISFVLGYRFMTSSWTTVSRRKIYAPTHMPDEVVGTWVIEDPTCPGGLAILDGSARAARWLRFYSSVVRHEICHTRQIRRWLLLFHLTYLWFPLPVLLAWGRWRWEREAYLINLREGTHTVPEVVDILWSGYFWTWPKAWMRRWFLKKLASG